jgi:hypothetical protein
MLQALPNPFAQSSARNDSGQPRRLECLFSNIALGLDGIPAGTYFSRFMIPFLFEPAGIQHVHRSIIFQFYFKCVVSQRLAYGFTRAARKNQKGHYKQKPYHHTGILLFTVLQAWFMELSQRVSSGAESPYA